MPLPKRVSLAARLSTVPSRYRRVTASARPRLFIACGIEVAAIATPGRMSQNSGGGRWLSEFLCHSIWETAPSW